MPTLIAKKRSKRYQERNEGSQENVKKSEKMGGTYDPGSLWKGGVLMGESSWE